MSQTKWITTQTVREYIVAELPGVIEKSSWGETAYFYNPGNVLKNGTYFATIKEKNGDNDRGSDLDREGVWRLNIGVPKASYHEMFGPFPDRPGKGCTIDGPWDFTQIDMIMPHPVYAWMGWVAVLSPSENTWRDCITLLDHAHGRARKTFEKRTKR